MNYDIVCVSHLRWNFVFQRPQHLMSRAAQKRKVIFLEEPVYEVGSKPHLASYQDGMVTVATPHLPQELAENAEAGHLVRYLLNNLLSSLGIRRFVLWMYTPMSLPYLEPLEASAVVYDCMDELANFRFAPPVLRERERALFHSADLVFTGGASLYEAKCHQHPNIHCFPSSVEFSHFAKARQPQSEPRDLSQFRRPRAGFYGVIDERMDVELLATVADKLPELEFVMVGPLAKVTPEELPKSPNLRFLGPKNYRELPQYLAHWDVALMPFALNDATRFISPTKTPEYLAAAKPVVSTAIKDVVRPYGEKGLVYIANTPSEFCEAIRKALYEDQAQRQSRADAFLSKMSWEETWNRMEAQINQVVASKERSRGFSAASSAATAAPAMLAKLASK